MARALNKKSNTSKRDVISPKGDQRYVRRNDKGQFTSSSLSQVRNSATGNYILRDAVSGAFIGVKSDIPYKGVRTSKSLIKSNPSVKKSIAKKAEKAVIRAKSKKK